jgi:Kef-type K+ transport system membrane component KefB
MRSGRRGHISPVDFFRRRPRVAIVIGSLLASHTLLGLPIVDRLGLGGMSDTLSLVVFAICVSIYTTGFSPSGLSPLLAEITGYIVLVLFGLSRLGAYLLGRDENEEDAYFILMLSIMAIAGVLADAIQLAGIVGAFLAGLAVNASAHGKPASAKLEFLGKSLFIPIFFVVTGFLINPVTFVWGDSRQLFARCRHRRCPTSRQMDGCLGH